MLGFALTGVTEEENLLVSNKLRSELVNFRKFRVITRNQIEALIEEQALGQTLLEASEAARAEKM